MAYNKLQIVNLALSYIGSAPVSAIGSSISVQASDLFDLRLNADIVTSNPSFAQRFGILDLLPYVPPIQYFNYAYKLPSDFLKIQYIVPGDSVNYIIIENKVMYCNVPPTPIPQILYVFLPRPEDLPAPYVESLALQVAERLGLTALKADMRKELNAASNNARNMAMALDGQQNPNPVITTGRYNQTGGWWGFSGSNGGI